MDKFIQTIMAVHEAVDPASATTAAEERRTIVLEFLKSHPGQEFTASEIRVNTDVPKAVMFKLLDGVAGVGIDERNGKWFYTFRAG
ncbi:MAG: hypothetical protein CMJ64_04580 [Planctomycetaceae bacterium]|nr:hypothetical protein [Planctomycetaceae bacterium]